MKCNKVGNYFLKSKINEIDVTLLVTFQLRHAEIPFLCFVNGISTKCYVQGFLMTTLTEKLRYKISV